MLLFSTDAGFHYAGDGKVSSLEFSYMAQFCEFHGYSTAPTKFTSLMNHETQSLFLFLGSKSHDYIKFP